jgi:RNA polymerase sigma-70 factor (ECF subfamily)
MGAPLLSSSLDDQLAGLAKDGNLEAYGELVTRYQTAVFNTCYRLVSQRGDAEDLTQDTFLRAYERFHTFDVHRPFRPWILRIATNLCWNFLKRNSSQENFSYDEEIDGIHQNLPLSPEGFALIKERDQKIYKAIASLPPNYRVVIELKHFQDKSYADISDQLEMSLSNVKSNLFRARKLLAEKLREPSI